MAGKKAAPKSKALVATKSPDVLPADEKPDTALVDKAVAFIREKTGEMKKSAVEIGQYVLDTFFQGDAEKVSSKNPKKNASYAALIERCGRDLPLNKTTLSNWVGIALMSKRLPAADAAFKQLPSSYQEALLPLRDATKVEKFAGEATANNWSQRDLREKVAKERTRSHKKDDGRGRPPTPAVLKALSGGGNAFIPKDGEKPFSLSHVKELNAEQAKRALKMARNLANDLAELIGRLESRE